jgi:hypothetical protein
VAISSRLPFLNLLCIICFCLSGSWGKNNVLFVLFLDQKYQKSSANDAPPRSEKTAKIQAKGAGHNAISIYDSSLCFEGIIPCIQSVSFLRTRGRACFAGFAAVFSFTRALPAVRAGLRTQPVLNLAFRV